MAWYASGMFSFRFVALSVMLCERGAASRERDTRVECLRSMCVVGLEGNITVVKCGPRRQEVEHPCIRRSNLLVALAGRLALAFTARPNLRLVRTGMLVILGTHSHIYPFCIRFLPHSAHLRQACRSPSYFATSLHYPLTYQNPLP